MKLATYQDGSRDGQLIVVSRNLASAHYATHIANRLQQVLDDWNYLSPQLQDLSDALNAGKARHSFALEPQQCMAPLPRAYQWVDSYAFVAHLELLGRAHGEELPAGLSSEPQMVQCSGDSLSGPCEPLEQPDDGLGLDFGAGLAVVTDGIPAGSSVERSLDGVRLLMLCNSTSLHRLDPDAHPDALRTRTAFGPVAVTPDELGDAWSRGRVHLPLRVTWNGRAVGRCDAGAGMTFHFGRLLAHLCQTRAIGAGAIVGCGPVCNATDARKGRGDGSGGYSAIAQKRAVEILQDGRAATGFLQVGDTVRIDMTGRDGASLFGAIEQEVRARTGVRG